MTTATDLPKARQTYYDVFKAAEKVFDVNEHTTIIEAECDAETYDIELPYPILIELDAVATVRRVRFRAGFCSWLNVLVVSRITEVRR